MPSTRSRRVPDVVNVSEENKDDQCSTHEETIGAVAPRQAQLQCDPGLKGWEFSPAFSDFFSLSRKSLRVSVTESCRGTSVSQGAGRVFFNIPPGRTIGPDVRPEKARSSGPKIGQTTSLAAIGFNFRTRASERFPSQHVVHRRLRPGRRRRARRHHRSRRRKHPNGEDLRMPDEDGDGQPQTTQILLHLRALHPRASISARSLPRSFAPSPRAQVAFPATAPPPFDPAPARGRAPIDRVVVVRGTILGRLTRPRDGVGSLRDIREGFVVGGGL